jgi:phosphate-selective porin O/P
MEVIVRFEGRRRTLDALALAALVLGTAAVGGAQQTETPKAEPKPAAEAGSHMAIVGYAQFDYRHALDSHVSTAPEHEFNVRRARFTLEGRVGPRVAYNVNVQGDGLNPNTASLLDAYGDLTLWPWLKARAGQYKYEFDIEAREGEHMMPFPDRAMISNAVAGSLTGTSTFASTGSDSRDRGLTLLGSTKKGPVKWGYAVGVLQGAGRASDNNSQPAYTARLSADMMDGLKLTAGMLSTDNTNQGTPERFEYRAYTVGAAYERGRVFVRSEFYSGRRQRSAGNQDVRGFYVVGSYSPFEKVDVMVRHQGALDEKFTAGGDHVRSTDFGIKYYFDRREHRSGTLVTLVYELRHADQGVTSGTTLLADGRGTPLTKGSDVCSIVMARFQVRF